MGARARSLPTSWKLLNVTALILAALPLVVAQSCVPYTPSSFPGLSHLQCTQRLTPCHLVTTSNNATSFVATENQLSNILSQAKAGVGQSGLSQECVDGFLALYCLRTYRSCRQDGEEEDEEGVCQDDCLGVMRGVCGGGGWAYLSGIIDQLRRNGLVELETLGGSMDYCNTTTTTTRSTGRRCLALHTNETCTTSTSPPESPSTSMTTPTPSSVSSSTIIAAAVVVSLIFIAIIAVTVAALVTLTVSGYKKRLDPSHTSTRTSAQQSRKASCVETQQLNSLADRQERRQSSSTLMMGPEVVHEVLLNPVTKSRTTTFARRIKSNFFLQQPAKQRLKQLEYPRGNICLLRDLWETNFGPIYLGEASGLDPKEDLSSVFIKSLKDRASEKLKQQFTLEMTWASSFNHPHVISLLGVCTMEEPRYMIFEYLDYGSLKEFLQSMGSISLYLDPALGGSEMVNIADVSAASGSGFGAEDLAGMAQQVASGMDYLAKKAFILKDLAARNCQVGQNLVVKIANFGLNYDRTSDDYCCIRSHKSTPVPLRWLAPETLHSNRFSVYSDIWAFGVLLWEIFSFGARPYGDLSNSEVAKSILEGRQLDSPERCPEAVYELMCRCWEQQPSSRPWFHTIVTDMDRLQGARERKVSMAMTVGGSKVPA